jgi:hypothetical protein
MQNLEHVGTDGKIILEWSLQKYTVEGVYWRNLSEGRDQW